MNRLRPQIEEEIKRCGPVSFARFMELALYAPALGYYEQQRQIGRRGDFFTSVSAGPLFGELLAFQLAEWLEAAAGPERPQIIEAGPHQGTLAADILDWMQRHRPELFDRLEYCLIEPSPTRRDWQERTVHQWLANVTWVEDIAKLGASERERIIFCNEFLDAMPLHRLSWNAAEKKWAELLVGCEIGTFVWQRAAPPVELKDQLPRIPAELAGVLPDGYVIEHSPSAIAWWKRAAEIVAHGKLLTVDYGLTASECFRPERTSGTLRTFTRHHHGSSPLDDPGESDITAHINFSAIEAAGRAAGLITEGLIEQGKFLTQIMAQTQAAPARFDHWTPARTKQFQTLTHPEHLGRAFRVLIQSR